MKDPGEISGPTAKVTSSTKPTRPTIAPVKEIRVSKKVKVVVSTPAPWKVEGGSYLSVSVPCGMKAEAYRRSRRHPWNVEWSGGKPKTLNQATTDNEAVKAMKDGLRDRLLAELTALHDDAPDGDAGGGTERVETVARAEG